MNKKGVEISMNVIIVAALGLIVLLILTIMVVNKMGVFGGTSSSCDSLVAQGGAVCAAKCGSSDYNSKEYAIVDPTKSCEESSDGSKQYCCLKGTI